MSASNTDKFKKLTNNFSTTLSSAIVGSGDTSASLASTTNLPTDTGIVIVVDRVNSSGTATPSTREYMIGTVSGGNITNLLRGVGNSTAQAHSTGAVVEQVVDQKTINDIVDGILQDHDQQGRHKQLTDTNGNVILGLSATTGAVNYIQIANAATGNSAQLQAQGTDANVGITRVMKGLGNDSVKGRADGWNDLSGFGSFIYNANNGQKEFVINTPSDLSSFLYPGQKIALTRSTTPPTQSMAFTAASSQYATKASPSGFSNWTAFTCEGWVYLNSYPASGMMIVNRLDAAPTNGFYLHLLGGTGQLEVGYCGGAGPTSINTYQSIPLKRWVHVAAAVSSTASKTATLYINGVAVPSTANGTASTSLVQPTANLSVGAWPANATPQYFDGYMSEVRVWAVAQSQASIQANMAISLTGAETNLVFLAQGNGNFNDKTSNANNLTATNGAIATQAAYPYHSIEYGFLTNVTSSQLTIFTGTDYCVPNMAFSAVQYSTSRAPAGFPASRGKWIVDTIVIADTASNNNTTTPVLAAGYQLTVPTGEWGLMWSASMYFYNSGTSGGDLKAYLETSAGAGESVGNQWGVALYAKPGVSTENVTSFATGSVPISLSSATTYYANHFNGVATTNSRIRAWDQPGVIRAECAYI